jgi:UDP-N-acetylglucosamine 2-epimerase (non-hydrolysing)
MKKAALVVGTRPQFVKTAPLVLELGRFFKTILIHTGQHYDFIMSENFFKELAIPEPDYHLDLNDDSRNPGTGKMIYGLVSVLGFEKPDLVLVVGDTNSTLAGALAAARLRLPLAHVEAGVRSKDRQLPEQINRVVTDSISDYFLCPTPSAVVNLRQEGKNEHIYDTGDVIYDCLRLFQSKIPDKAAAVSRIPAEFILTTIHRAEAVDNRENLVKLLVSMETARWPVIFPVHPRTRKRMESFGLWNRTSDRIRFIEPVGYFDILSLIRLAKYVITDSGGIQREAVFLKKPVIVARPETEWIELVKSLWVKVAGYSFDLSRDPEVLSTQDEEIAHLMRPAAFEIACALSKL